jgi:hypothetical protein
VPCTYRRIRFATFQCSSCGSCMNLETASTAYERSGLECVRYNKLPTSCLYSVLSVKKCIWFQSWLPSIQFIIAGRKILKTIAATFSLSSSLSTSSSMLGLKPPQSSSPYPSAPLQHSVCSSDESQKFEIS